MRKCSDADNILSVKDVCWTVDGRTILDIPAFELGRGDVVSLFGSNGAGKSSLLKIMALLERPTSGEIFIDSCRVEKDLLSFRRRMSFIFQEPLLLSTSVYGNIAQGLRFRGFSKGAIEEKVSFWMEKFRISHLAGRSSRKLSGGEAQRVNLARAFAVDPEIMFLDEPFTALDLPTRIQLTGEIHGIIKERGISAVFVTHDPEEIAVFSDRVCVLDGGRIIKSGQPHNIFDMPAGRKTALLAVNEKVFEGFVTNDGSIFIDGVSVRLPENELPENTRVQIFLKPKN